MSLVFLALAAATAVAEPIFLRTRAEEGAVRIEVLGRSETAAAASYELVATSGAGNRTVQRGFASLVPGREAVLLSLRMGQGAGAEWSAVLTVEAGAHRYVRLAGSGREAARD